MNRSNAVRQRTPATAAPARGARMTVGVLAAVLLGGVAHIAAGGSWSGPGIALGALLLTVPTWLLTGSERRWPTISALLFGGQFVVHWSFAMAGHEFTVPSPAMLGYHLITAALVGWWLRRGERALWQAARKAVAEISEVLRRLLNDPRTTRTPSLPVPAGHAVPHLAVLRHSIALRAPPVVR
jgi:hypothetical protein